MAASDKLDEKLRVVCDGVHAYRTQSTLPIE
jgi:hypothetical protein